MQHAVWNALPRSKLHNMVTCNLNTIATVLGFLVPSWSLWLFLFLILLRCRQMCKNTVLYHSWPRVATALTLHDASNEVCEKMEEVSHQQMLFACMLCNYTLLDIDSSTLYSCSPVCRSLCLSSSSTASTTLLPTPSPAKSCTSEQDPRTRSFACMKPGMRSQLGRRRRRLNKSSQT